MAGVVVRADVPDDVRKRIDALAEHAHGVANTEHELSHWRDTMYRVFGWAVKNGELPLMQWLCELPLTRYEVRMCDCYVEMVAEHGHLDIVQRLLNLHTDRVQLHAAQCAGIRGAVFGGHLHVIKFLCQELPPERRADVFTRGGYDGAPLMTAVRMGHLDVLQYMFQMLLDHNVDDVIGWIRHALIRASKHGFAEVVSYLCELCELLRDHGGGFDEDIADRVLLNAVREGSLATVKYICERWESKVDLVLIWEAATDVEIVRYLCELPRNRGVDPGADSNAALRFAASNGDLDVVRYLCTLPLERGVDPAAEGNEAICSAAGWGHIDIVRFLCEEVPAARGVDATAGGNAALKAAVGGSWCARFLGIKRWANVVLYLYDVPGVAKLTPPPTLVMDFVVERVSNTNHLYAPVTIPMLTFLVQALPGGDQWLNVHDNVDRLVEDLKASDAPQCRVLVKWIHKLRVWHHHRTLLQLRLLCDKGRAQSLRNAGRRRVCGADAADTTYPAMGRAAKQARRERKR